MKKTKNDKLFYAGIYLRLSREDGDKNESDSIQNQRGLTMSYIANNDTIVMVEEYVDDGYSGTNFERPGFRKMIADIKEGHINCVVVKDLSRFGREYIEAGRYLEQMFVDYGVRFIAVNDNVDSLNGEYDIIVPIKNLFNAQYALDISKKVQSAFKVKQRSGEFVGAFASYGYKKSETDRHCLLVDDYAAAVVRRIFDMYLSGMGKNAIAKKLNEDGVLCPSAYKKMSGMNYTNGNRLERTTYWTYSSVCRILENQMYIGNMVQGKTRRRMKGKAKLIDESEWIIVKGTHEPIISIEKWERTQALLSKEAKSPNFNQNVSPFAGFLKCGDCGRAMCKKTHNGKMWYSCGSYTRYGNRICSSHYVSFDTINSILLDDIKKIIKSIDNLTDMINEQPFPSHLFDYYESERMRFRAELDKVSDNKLSLYGDYRDQLISREEYIQLRTQYTERETLLENKLATLDESKIERASSIAEIPWIKRLLECRDVQSLDREMLVDLVNMIYVFDDRRIRIVYNFDDELSSLLESNNRAFTA